MGCTASGEPAFAPEAKAPRRFLSCDTADMCSQDDFDCGAVVGHRAQCALEDTDDEDDSPVRASFAVKNRLPREGDYERHLHAILTFGPECRRVAVFKSFELEEGLIVVSPNDGPGHYSVLLSTISCFQARLNPAFADTLTASVLGALDQHFRSDLLARKDNVEVEDPVDSPDTRFPRTLVPIRLAGLS